MLFWTISSSSRFLVKQQCFSVEELPADSCHVILKLAYLPEKLRGQICLASLRARQNTAGSSNTRKNKQLYMIYMLLLVAVACSCVFQEARNKLVRLEKMLQIASKIGKISNECALILATGLSYLLFGGYQKNDLNFWVLCFLQFLGHF